MIWLHQADVYRPSKPASTVGKLTTVGCIDYSQIHPALQEVRAHSTLELCL